MCEVDELPLVGAREDGTLHAFSSSDLDLFDAPKRLSARMEIYGRV